MTTPDTPVDQIAGIVAGVREAYNTGVSRPLEFRRAQLKALLHFLDEKKLAINDAMKRDLGRHEQESVLGEIVPAEACIKDMLANITSWAAPRGVSTPVLQLKGLSTSQIIPEPKGVVLVMSPWNYPIQLPIIGIATAISAGNCVVLKPSEISEASTKLLFDELPNYLDPRIYKCVTGAIPQSTEILRQRFDHILYTGNGAVGRIVMRAAAEHLTPVTLELGGKSPVIIDDEVDMAVAARRVVWGRCFNAGQSCVSCDYVLVHAKSKDKFIAAVKECISNFYGEDPKSSESYGFIINNRQWTRLANLIKESIEEDPNCIIAGGDVDESKKYISPTVVLAKGESAVMRDEIFGPILPIITVDSINQAIQFINDRPKPLALYIFTKHSSVWEKVIENTSSGGIVVNDSLVHYTVPGLPFGGVGESGIGAYHGKTGFDNLSHLKAVLNKTTKFDLDLRYPPYSSSKLKQINMLNW
jgi:acyl-CoA reductase-like NAD-dependent aldehyde dehydrogenase